MEAYFIFPLKSVSNIKKTCIQIKQTKERRTIKCLEIATFDLNFKIIKSNAIIIHVNYKEFAILQLGFIQQMIHGCNQLYGSS